MRPLHTGMAVLVVAAALLIVGEHLVRFGAFLEPDFRLGAPVAVVAIGVILHRQPAIRALDLLPARVARDAEDLVIISLGDGHGAQNPRLRRIISSSATFA